MPERKAMTTRETLHHLVDELPESEVKTARRFLEYLRDSSSDEVLSIAKQVEES